MKETFFRVPIEQSKAQRNLQDGQQAVGILLAMGGRTIHSVGYLTRQLTDSYRREMGLDQGSNDWTIGAI